MFRINQKNRGFSLVEMLVVLAIVAFVTSTIFANFPKMNSKLALDLLTQDVALTIRQAQIYGTTVFGVGVTGDAFNSSEANYKGYGVSFPSTDLINSDGNYVYTLFADIPPSSGDEADTSDINSTKNRYNEGTSICMANKYSYENSCLGAVCGNAGTVGGTVNECSQRFVVAGKNKIDLLCLNYFSGGNNISERVASCQTVEQNCRQGQLSQPDSGSAVDIVFKRPKLQAEITTLCNGEYSSPENIGIVIKSDSGEYRAVVVWKNGQIAVDR